MILVTRLFMPVDEASTPQPTYAHPPSSRTPWTHPSSPNVPCRTGTKTSTFTGLPSPPARAPRPDPSETGTSEEVPNPADNATSTSRDRSGPPPLNDSVFQRSSPIHQRVD